MVDCVVILDFSNCEADINYYFERYDPDTRQWLLKDFDSWFSNPGNSRAYVLLGDAAVGKSVMAAVIAKRAQDSGNMAAAFFCRYYDGTRRDPRYLLGTIAYQLCNCYNQYNRLLGGEEGIHRMLVNSKLGLHELFTKLLEEPLSQCKSCMRKLVVIDALDESEYWSREDFLDLIMDRFPFLPKWLVFFITSRPEDTLQCRLKRYNPCIKICAGNNDSANLYQQHNLDIQTFLQNKVDFSSLSHSPEELTNQCNGMFLYAFYVAKMLNTETYLENKILPENIYGFFRKNFKRLYDKLGKEFYRKLFGCVVMSPSPLPLSFISFLLKKESLSADEQEVIDAVSQFVTLRNTDNTFAFLHGLIPEWLTDEQKASRKLYVEKDEASKYYRNIIVHYLNAFLQDESENLFLNKVSLVNYMLCVGFYFLCTSGIKDSKHSEIIFNCLTNYRFLQLRIKSSKIGIYSLIDELEFSIKRLSFDASKKAVLGDISSALKRDKIILVGNHQLLHSCLCSSTCRARNKVIPENMSGADFRSNIKVPLAREFSSHIDLDCGAFSHDKKLFAAGKGQYLYLYDGFSFETILGPVEVMDGSISHLEFSPDDKFVFFGRLDEWFSVHEKCVVEVSQFSGKRASYVWGSFICDGKYIAVRRPVQHDRDAPINNELIRWAKCELIRCPPKNANFEILLRKLNYLIRLPNSDSVKTAIRDYIVCNYAEIFEGQIWNVQTGRPVLEEMFTTQLEPFFYFWHTFSKMRNYPFELFDESITLSHVAFLNAWRCGNMLDDWSEKEIRNEYKKIGKLFRWGERFIPRIISNLLPVRAPVHFRYSIAERGRECYSFMNKDGEIFSKDGKWLQRRQYGHKIELFEEEIYDCSHLLFDAQDVKDYAFTDDNDALVYSTPSANLYAISLVAGTKLRSISGLCPVSCPSGDRQHLGFIFSSTNESKVLLLRDLPAKFLVNSCLSVMASKAVGVTFTSRDKFGVLFSNGTFGSWKIVDGSLVSSDRAMPPSQLMELQQVKFPLAFISQFQARKFFFSHSGDIIVVDEGSQIVLLKRGTSTPIQVRTLGSVACVGSVTFSSDDSLILFCIQKINDDQCFYIWNVNNTITLTGPLCLDGSPRFDMHVDSCCFSSDNCKLFFCNAFSVLILEHEANNAAVTKLQKRYINSHPSDICSHCTVSCDDTLLACCIANEIVICSVDDTDKFYKLPHQHFRQIQYCKFLCGKRYLISYGMDMLMFLFDLVARQSIAYLRLSESCISIAISPNEDKIVCLESLDKISLIYLHGLESDWISNLELPSKANHTPQGAHLVLLPAQTETEDERYLMHHGDDLSSSESNDEYAFEEEMDITSS